MRDENDGSSDNGGGMSFGFAIGVVFTLFAFAAVAVVGGVGAIVAVVLLGNRGDDGVSSASCSRLASKYAFSTYLDENKA